MLEDHDRAELVSLLAWYREMGVDEVVAEAPFDWLADRDTVPGAEMVARLRSGDSATVAGRTEARAARFGEVQRPGPTRAASAVRSTLPRVEPRPASPSSHADESKVDPSIRAAPSLAALRGLLDAFDGCGLRNTAKNLCFYRGSEEARLMIIGEAPGRDEDIQGKPFVGRAGQLLDRMLATIGLAEADAHITNVVYWRPPGNRTPTPQEVQACRPFLERQIELVRPEIVLLLGGSAAKHVLDVSEGIMRLRGTWRTVDIAGRKLRALATLHPAYLLRTPAAKRLAWQDLRSLSAALAN